EPLWGATIGSSEGVEHLAALAFAVGAVALQALQLGKRAVEIRPQLLHLVIDWTALLRLAAEQREEAAALAAEPPRLRGDAVEVALLATHRIFAALTLTPTRPIQ